MSKRTVPEVSSSASRFVVAGMLMVLHRPETASSQPGTPTVTTRWRRSPTPHGTLERHPVALSCRRPARLSAGRTVRGNALRLQNRRPNAGSCPASSPPATDAPAPPDTGHRRSWRHPRRCRRGRRIEHVEQSRESLPTCSSDIFAVSAMSVSAVRRVAAVCAALTGITVDARVTHCRHLRVLRAGRR